MSYPHVAEHMKRLRRRHFMTQAELAEALEVDTRTVQRIESGATNPSKRTLRALGRVFDLGPETLLEAPDAPPADADEVRVSWMGPGSFADPVCVGQPSLSGEWFDVRVEACRDASTVAEAFESSEFFRVVPGAALQAHQATARHALDWSVGAVFDDWGRGSNDERKRMLEQVQEAFDALDACGLVFAFERVEVELTSFQRRIRRPGTLLVMTVLRADQSHRVLRVPTELSKTLRRDIDVRVGHAKVPMFWTVRRRDDDETASTGE